MEKKKKKHPKHKTNKYPWYNKLVVLDLVLEQKKI